MNRGSDNLSILINDWERVKLHNNYHNIVFSLFIMYGAIKRSLGGIYTETHFLVTSLL